ncbi:lipoprotein [Spirochaetia bacterium]|nr:lipoprotein [Spirochaetia bacterium]
MFDKISNNFSGTGSSGKADPQRRAAPDSSNWDIEKLDTAKDADYLSGIEKDVVLEMNMVRSDPKKYAVLYIQPKLQYFNGNNYSVPGQITLVTQEGKKAVDGCIAALSKMKSVALLTPELGLSLGAKDHTNDQGKTGQTGHDGSDRSTPFTRINRYGSGYKTAGENLAYGGTSGRDMVTQLLIDDGVPSRGHRTNIMNKDFSQTGVSFGTHAQYRTMCAITYASGYTSN